MTDGNHRRLPQAGSVLRFLATLALLALVLWWVGPASIAEAVVRAEPVPLVVAVFLVPAGVLLTALAWKIILRTVDPATDWKACFRGVLVGTSTGLVTPARIGEIAPRILYGSPDGRTRRGAGFLLETGLRFAAQFLIAGTAWLLVAPQLFPGGGPELQWAGTALLTVGICILALALWPRRALKWLVRIPVVRSYLGDLDTMQIVGPASVTAVLLLTFARYSVATLQFVLLLSAVGLGIQAVPAALVLFGKGVIPNLFITDLGVREGLAAFVFSRLGLDAAAAVAASLLIYLLNLVLPAMVGMSVAGNPAGRDRSA